MGFGGTNTGCLRAGIVVGGAAGAGRSGLGNQEGLTAILLVLALFAVLSVLLPKRSAHSGHRTIDAPSIVTLLPGPFMSRPQSSQLGRGIPHYAQDLFRLDKDCRLTTASDSGNCHCCVDRNDRIVLKTVFHGKGNLLATYDREEPKTLKTKALYLSPRCL